MSNPIEIRVTGAEELIRAFDQFKDRAGQYLREAGKEAAKEILWTRGLKIYPPADEANQPGRTRTVTFEGGKTAVFRVGYYIRGRGMMVPVRGGDYALKGKSEKYGSRYTTRVNGYGSVSIVNNASYAKHLGGEDQTDVMARRGWRKLADVAEEKIARVTRIYQQWIDDLLRDLKLR